MPIARSAPRKTRAVVRAAAELGIIKVRLSGREPLVRADSPKLSRMLCKIEGIEELSLTTNAVLLKEYARELKQAGLTRVNLSLNALKPDKFRHITRLGKLEAVLAGNEAANRASVSWPGSSPLCLWLVMHLLATAAWREPRPP